MKRSWSSWSRSWGLVAGAALVAVLSMSPGATGAPAHDQARESAAASAHAAFEAQYNAGTSQADVVYVWSVRWLEASKKTKTTLAAAQAHLARMRTLKGQVKGKVAAGLATAGDDKAATYYVAEAEVWVADAGGAP